MSAQDDGGGPGSGRSARENEVFGHPLDAAQHFFSQSDPHSASRSNSNSLGNAPSLQTWGNNALNAQQSEVSLMAQGAGRPGQPAGGQRPIFGGGSPVFAQMPTYTPVTRGPELRPQAPQPQPAYTPYNPSPAPAQPSQQAASGLSYPSPQAPSPLSYPSLHPAPRRAIRALIRAPRRATRTRSRSRLPAIRLSSRRRRANRRISPRRPISPPISRFVRRASRAPSIPARRPIPHRAITARKAYPSQPYRQSELCRCELSRAGIGGCELPRIRASIRISPIRISAIRISPSRILPMRASRSRRASTQASPTRAFPARMASLSRSRPRRLRPWRSGRSRLRFLPQRAGAGLRPGAAKRSAAATASLRRHLRSAAADFAGLDRAEPPAGAGFLRGRAARCRFPRRGSGASRARRPRQVRDDVQRPQRLHGGQRAARRHRSRRRLGLRLQAERRRSWQRAAALGHGRQPAGEGASR